jgi:hypothetical protein
MHTEAVSVLIAQTGLDHTSVITSMDHYKRVDYVTLKYFIEYYISIDKV